VDERTTLTDEEIESIGRDELRGEVGDADQDDTDTADTDTDDTDADSDTTDA
jgi:hypothetical protein